MKFEEALKIINELKADNTLEINKRGISEKGLVVFDTDDTLVKANPNVIKVYKSINGKEIALSTAQFATDKDKAAMGKNVKMYNTTADAPATGIAFSIREFRDPKKVYDSIVKGTPILANLRLMDNYVQKGWHVSFLTARGLEGTVAKALSNFLRTKNQSGKLVPLGDSFKKAISAAVNDEDIKYAGIDDGDKKGRVLRRLCSYYNYVVFVDDDARNINAANALGLKNLKVIKAAKLGETLKVADKTYSGE